MNSINKTARVEGFLYLMVVPLGIFGSMYVPSRLIVRFRRRSKTDPPAAEKWTHLGFLTFIGRINSVAFCPIFM
jgi:hypothetical protein